MNEEAKPKTSDKDSAATPEPAKSKTPSAPNDGRLGPAADPAEGKRD
jgi:hypothetical protein